MMADCFSERHRDGGAARTGPDHIEPREGTTKAIGVSGVETSVVVAPHAKTVLALASICAVNREWPVSRCIGPATGHSQFRGVASYDEVARLAVAAIAVAKRRRQRTPWTGIDGLSAVRAPGSSRPDTQRREHERGAVLPDERRATHEPGVEIAAVYADSDGLTASGVRLPTCCRSTSLRSRIGTCGRAFGDLVMSFEDLILVGQLDNGDMLFQPRVSG